MDNERDERGGIPARVLLVAAATWTVTILAVAVMGEHPVMASRALLYVLPCLAAGAWAEVFASAARRWSIAVVWCVVLVGSQFGRGYVDSHSAVSGTEVAIVSVVAVVIFVASRALAAQITPMVEPRSTSTDADAADRRTRRDLSEDLSRD